MLGLKGAYALLLSLGICLCVAVCGCVYVVVSFCSGIAVSMVMKYADNIVKVRLGFMTVL